jgi:hypothetical protein
VRLRFAIQREWLEQVPAGVDATEAMRLLVNDFSARYRILPIGRQQGPLDGAGRKGMRLLGEALARSRNYALLAEASDGDRVFEVRPR